jgi:hypothetical protein
MATYIIGKLNYTDNTSGSPVSESRYIANIDSGNLQLLNSATPAEVTKKWDEASIDAAAAQEIVDFREEALGIATATIVGDYSDPSIELNEITG